MMGAKVSLLQVTKGVPTAQRFTDFKQRLEDAKKKNPASKHVLAVCRKAHRDLRLNFSSLTTLRRYYTHYRNICREAVPENLLGDCLKILNLTQDETLYLNSAYEKKVSEEHTNLRPIQNYQGMIAKAQGLLGERSIYSRILGVAFLTGRRVAEIACTAEFKPTGEKSILFDGQLKGKARVIHQYEIPTLGDPALLAKALKAIREEKPAWIDNPMLFHDCGSRELSLRVKRHFSEFIDNPTVKDLRASYAEVCYKMFGTQTKAKSRYFSELLGHGEEDNRTGQSYIDFYIKE